MQIKSDSEEVVSLIREARSVALVTNHEASSDTISAMLAFYHLFKQNGKVRIVVPEAVPDDCQHLPESSVISHDLGPKNLVISLDTKGSALSKISYYQEGPIFNLIIHPKERSFEVENIRYSYEGGRFDLFVIFSVLRLEDLGDLYSKNEKEFSATTIINLDFRRENARFGSINLIDEFAGGPSEVLFKKLAVWNLVPNREAAVSLLNGLVLSQNKVSGTPDSVSSKKVLAADPDDVLAKGGLALIQ